MNNMIWVEKYRPSKIGDLVVDDLMMTKINNFITNKEIPNILITGVAGIGKTSTIQCLAKHLLGKHHKEGILELNASDERGIKMVREIVTNFCRKKINYEGDDSCHHKIIVLDEADNLTTKAQQQINNLMDLYSKTTRFAFTCNNSTDMITAIKSRCNILRYKRLTNEQVQTRLKHIADQEKVVYTEGGLLEIAKVSNGDLRQAINNLQLIFDGYGSVHESYVMEFCEKPDPVMISTIFKSALKGDLKKAIAGLSFLENKGYSSPDIIYSMINSLQNDEMGIDEKTKINLMRQLTKTQMVINKGVISKLQLSGCIANIYLTALETST